MLDSICRNCYSLYESPFIDSVVHQRMASAAVEAETVYVHTPVFDC